MKDEVPQVQQFDAYQKWTETTLLFARSTPRNIGRMNYTTLYLLLGLAGEAGEVADKAKKVIRDNDGGISAEARNDLAAELGDTLWYLAQLASDLGYRLSEVAEMNVQKLESRKARNVIQGNGDHR